MTSIRCIRKNYKIEFIQLFRNFYSSMRLIKENLIISNGSIISVVTRNLNRVILSDSVYLMLISLLKRSDVNILGEQINSWRLHATAESISRWFFSNLFSFKCSQEFSCYIQSNFTSDLARIFLQQKFNFLCLLQTAAIFQKQGKHFPSWKAFF